MNKKKPGRPKLSGTSVYIRMSPEMRKKIDVIHQNEKPKIGTLSLNALLSFLINAGIERYENEKEKEKK